MGDVCKTIRVGEAKFDTRARASSSTIPTPREIASSSKTMPTLSLIDEDEKIVNFAEEKDGEGFKCDNGNDDDDFVDLEDN